MASSIIAYDHLWKLQMIGAVPHGTATLKMALVTSSYTPSTAHDEWADVSANEVSNGSGYTTGGVTLTGATVTNSSIDYADPAWTALTKTFRYAVCYMSGSAAGLTNPLLFYILLDTTPADIVSSGSNYSITINATDKLFYRPA